MDNKRFALSALIGGVALGIVSLGSPYVRDFVDGLLGIPLESSSGTVDLRADLAASALDSPLRREEVEELLHGAELYLKGRYAEAIPIIGKYALLGDDMAQSVIGAMYVFGQGFPLNKEEGLRWLTLAAAQGDQGATQLVAAINATPQWEQRVAALAAALSETGEWREVDTVSRLANSEGALVAPQYDFQPITRRNSYPPPRSVYDSSSPFAMIRPSSPQLGARASIDQAYRDEPASRRYISPPSPSRPLDFGSPVILNRAGPGTYSDASGDIYAQAGPHGVVNTRTDEFSPTN